MTEFVELEAKDGIRMTWNVVPGTKQEAATCVVPVAAVYTPLKPIAPLLQYSPLRCRTCRSVLNSFSSVDHASKIWTCPLCYQRNHFPLHHSSLSEDNLPSELFPQHTTVEYQLDACGPPPLPPVYLFVVDTCIIEGEMMFLKSALSQAVELLPDNPLIGLITFGTDVQVHELGFGHMPKCYVFKGTKEVTKDRLLDQMGFFAKTPRPHSGVIGGLRDGLSSESIARFLMTASECEFAVISILEGLQKDPWHVPADQRATRCTGTALSVAACLLGVCMPGSGARIMAFVGGPSTEGLGSIATKNLSEPVRSHKDVDKSTSALYNEAVKFYEGLSKQLVHQGHVLDLFACALDQVGVAEMKVLVERTGGIVVLAESFGHSVFKDSLRRVFQSNEDHGLSSNGVFEINCSTNIKVQGIIGPCASLGKKGPLCSELVIGQGNTSAWKMCGLDKGTSLCIIFEIAKTDASSAIMQSASNQLYFQFLTYYQHGNGQMRLRATTISRRWVAGSGSLQDLIAGFDQEAATTVIARLVSFKMETEVDFDPVRWIDRQLIRLYSCFGEYKKDTPASFSISPRLSLFPRFIYHLRRSQFVQVFNSSPDETAYFRMLLYRENVMNSVLMIQPSLISYSLNSLPEAALLDITAISADRILLMDSYFAIVIFHGTTITQWRKAGYHIQPEHVLFAQLLKAPHDDANEIIKERFPTPRLVVCDQYGSQARFLLAKLNPSITYNSTDPFRVGGDIIYTDDVSFEVFLNYLQRLAVQ